MCLATPQDPRFVPQPTDVMKAIVASAVGLLDDVADRYEIRSIGQFSCPHMRKLALAVNWKPVPSHVSFSIDEADKAQLDPILPYGLIRYLAEARELRRAPILIKDPGGINGVSTLVSNGKQCRRSWREIVGNLEHRGYGIIGPAKLARLMKGVK